MKNKYNSFILELLCKLDSILDTRSKIDFFCYLLIFFVLEGAMLFVLSFLYTFVYVLIYIF